MVLNPVRADVVERPEDWKWSSYLATAGIKKPPEYLTTDWILGQFGDKRREAEEQYKEFVISGIKEESPWKKLQGQVLFGGKGFIEKFRDLLSKKEAIREIPRLQRYVCRAQIADLFKRENISTKHTRNEMIYEAHKKYGYTLKEIADYLGIHYTTVSKVIKAKEDEN